MLRVNGSASLVRQAGSHEFAFLIHPASFAATAKVATTFAQSIDLIP